jgi:manganese/zinc/iron transport system permease protein
MDLLGYTFRNVLLGSSLLGLVGGVLGSFALLRRQSLLGDALAHAALPGVCIAFLVTGEKSAGVLLAGALGTGIAGALLVMLIVRGTRLIKEDSAIGIVLSVFFAVGIVLITLIQRLPSGNQSGLDKYLFGQAATLVTDDLRVMAIFGAGVLAAVALFYKEFKILSFDRAFGASLGLPMRGLEVLLTVLLVVVVVSGLQTVGVVLMVATLVTPAAAARQWTDRLGAMVLLSAVIGALSGAGGTLLSVATRDTPPGPTIVLVSSAVLVVSLLLAPRRGLLWARLRERRVQGNIRRENLLKDLYQLGEAAESWDAFVPFHRVTGVRGQGASELRRHARPLARADRVAIASDEIRLTPPGVEDGRQLVRKHRLWEVYLARRLELPPDHLHRDAEAMEHVLTEEAVNDFEERLGYPSADPHGKPIPRRRSS